MKRGLFRRWRIALFAWAIITAALAFLTNADAQNLSRICFRTGSGGSSCQEVTAANPFPVDASVSASIAGFEPAATGTPVAADDDGDTQTLPAGDVVLAMNTSTSVTAYCMLGAAATTADVMIPPQSAVAFTVGAATQMTCITASSTATINTVGGDGLPTGWGGGSGSGGGGTSSTYGAAFPATGTAIGFTDGTNMAAGRVGAVANVAAATNFVNALGVCQYLAAAPTLTDTRFNQLQCNVSGFLRTTVENTNANVGNNADDVAAGASAGSPVVNYGYVYDGTTWDRMRGTSADGVLVNLGTNNDVTVTSGAIGLASAATGGCTGGTAVSAASTNATVIKASAGTLCELDIQNPATTLYYFSLYNVASGPTCNSDTIVRQQIIPPASAAGQVGGIVISLGAYGQAFTTGIGFCITAAAAGTGNAATDIRVNYTFK